MQPDQFQLRCSVVQRIEQDIEMSLFKRLAALLATETGLTVIEARHQLRYAYGIIEVGEERKAEAVSIGFKQLGLDNFILEHDEFISYPSTEVIESGLPRIRGNPDVVAAGTILNENLVAAAAESSAKPATGSSRSRSPQVKKQIKKATLVDIFTVNDHFRMVVTPESMLGIEEWLRQTTESAGKIYLGEGAKRILDGNWDLIRTYSEDAHYERYLRWLVQLRYHEKRNFEVPAVAGPIPGLVDDSSDLGKTPKKNLTRPIPIAGIPQPSAIVAGALYGKTIGQHKILEEIGEGGMGIVYKAEQMSLGRTVAMKMLPQRLTHNASLVQRFMNEARAIAALNHPNIVQIYDVGQQETTYYYTMELVDGDSLDNILYRRGSLPLERVVGIIAKIANALNYMHRRGIVHRDVKPSNIMLDRRGGVKLTDFGLALQEGTTRLTMEGGIVGTPEYMSPEQAAGETATSSSDIYSLGVVFYELMTGRVPFEAETPLGVINRIQSDEPPPPRAIDPSVPPGIETIILKMMAKDPGKRYESCQTLLRDLRQFRSSERIPGDRSSALAVRRLVLKPVVIFLVVALLVGGGAYLAAPSIMRALFPPVEPEREQSEHSVELWKEFQLAEDDSAFQEKIAVLDTNLLSFGKRLQALRQAAKDSASDTVVLRDGTELKGELISSTARSIRFQSAGGVEEIPRSRIDSINHAGLEAKQSALALLKEIEATEKLQGELQAEIEKLRKVNAGEGAPMHLRVSHEPLVFKLLSSEKKDTQMIELYSNNDANAEKITYEVSPTPPEGVAIESKVSGSGKQLNAVITVSIDPSGTSSGSYDGNIHFVSSEAGVLVMPAYVLIHIDTASEVKDNTP